jgi:hypothetical protein
MILMGGNKQLALRGKLISLPRLTKWLRKMRFLAGSGHHAVDAAFFIDGRLIRGETR